MARDQSASGVPNRRQENRAVLHLRRRLLQEPIIPVIDGVSVRTYAGESDIDRWLGLRAKSFAEQSPMVRPWSRADFEVEILAKPWWSPEWMWFAESDGVIGSVMMAQRGRGMAAVPVVHWLMVLPDWRRAGVGKLLIATLESACWNAGYRRIALETHAGWSAAEWFYRALGYETDEG